jgi:hypothetical protein
MKKEFNMMKNARQIGGILLLLFAAANFIWLEEVPLPVAMALAIVGVALIASSRKRRA